MKKRWLITKKRRALMDAVISAAPELSPAQIQVLRTSLAQGASSSSK